VDEAGYLPLSRAEANMAFQLVARRCERRSIIVTSNEALSEAGQVLGDGVLASTILDRLHHNCDVVSTHRPNCRLKDHAKPKGGEAMA
jgi:DNA replication protein DnaC